MTAIIRISTPVVWAGPGIINQFAGNMSSLISDLNEMARHSPADFEVFEAFVEVHSVSQDKLLTFDKVTVQCRNTPIPERREKGMAYWWYTCVKEAFAASPKPNAVLYYPIDVCWDDAAENTVVNPFRLCGMLNLLAQQSDEVLLLGNYTSTNKNKDWIEEAILHILRSHYLDLNDDVTRVRTEFWGVTRMLFEEFDEYYFERLQCPCVPDPTLLFLIYCLNTQRVVMTYDLGTYRAEGEYSTQRMRDQLERGRRIIVEFKK